MKDMVRAGGLPMLVQLGTYSQRVDKNRHFLSLKRKTFNTYKSMCSKTKTNIKQNGEVHTGDHQEIVSELNKYGDKFEMASDSR